MIFEDYENLLAGHDIIKDKTYLSQQLNKVLCEYTHNHLRSKVLKTRSDHRPGLGRERPSATIAPPAPPPPYGRQGGLRHPLSTAQAGFCPRYLLCSSPPVWLWRWLAAVRQPGTATLNGSGGKRLGRLDAGAPKAPKVVRHLWGA